MSTTSKAAANQVTDYIESLPEWSKNICRKLRQTILQADPAIAEEWKWGTALLQQRNGMWLWRFSKARQVYFFQRLGHERFLKPV